jgi:hypothetical protein
MSTIRTFASGTGRREAWGSLRKLPLGRWQARYPAPRCQYSNPVTFRGRVDSVMLDGDIGES